MTTQANTDGIVYQLRDLSVNLRRRGQDRQILQSLNFEVRKRECLSIVGPSGTGKTTLLRALAGLIPVEGEITFQGQKLEGPAGDAVLVFQDYGNALLRWRTVKKNVALGIEGRIPREESRLRVDEALEIVGLQKYQDSYPWELSGGMQQRVQIARALAMKPQVLLFDEPFGSLDAMTREGLQDELLRVRSLHEATCVFITHDIDEAVYLGDRLMLLSGSPASLTYELDIPLTGTRSQISTKESAEFLRLRHQVYEQMRKAHGAAPTTE
ncbi:MAG: ABC transporter ATP-binding protein [Acidimicrobiaceae bacterium]|nr:ABC transporter ATP-binding protein [Acidimicrobiaceae bacterium]